MKNEATGMARLASAAQFSKQGFVAAYRSEAAFRQEVWLALILLPVSFLLADTPIEWIVLVVPVLLLMIVELLNTAVEAVVDRFGDEWNELSGFAKDTGSCAVLIAIIILVLSWLAVLIN